MGMSGRTLLVLLSASIGVPSSYGATSAITGKVTDTEGRPVQAIVHIDPVSRKTKYKVRTEKNGSYLYMGLPVGRYRVWAEFNGIGALEGVNVDTVPGSQVTANIELPAPGTRTPPQALQQRTIAIETPKGNVELTVTRANATEMALPRIAIEGVLHNNTTVDIEYLRFEIVFLGPTGLPLGVCNTLLNADHLCTVMVRERIPRGSLLTLEGPNNGFYVNSAALQSGTPSGIRARLINGFYTPRYSFETEASDNVQFDAAFQVSIKEGIAFAITNKVNSPIEILWDQSSFINELNESSRIIHAGVRYLDKEKAQPNTIVPPLSKVVETAFPASKIRWESGEWYKDPLLISTLDLGSDVPNLRVLVGKSFRLYLRLRINAALVDYSVLFRIKAVEF